MIDVFEELFFQIVMQTVQFFQMSEVNFTARERQTRSDIHQVLQGVIKQRLLSQVSIVAKVYEIFRRFSLAVFT